MDTTQIDLLGLVQQHTQLKKAAQTNGGEWSGPCPFCGGKDRFHVWPTPKDGKPRFWCRGCQASGDALSYVMARDNVGFKDACQRLGLEPGSYHAPARPDAPPRRKDRAIVGQRKEYAADSPAWQAAADNFCLDCWGLLWQKHSGEYSPGMAYLQGRGLRTSVMGVFELGYNAHPYRATWAGVDVWLPAGVVIPHVYGGRLLAVNVRRLDGEEPKYLKAKGSANGLFVTHPLDDQVVVIMVEGEFDAMVLWQETRNIAGGCIAPVATGSTHGGLLREWVVRLGVARRVVLAFDSDDAGEKAAERWRAAFPEAVRLVPTRHDVNEMLCNGDDVSNWVKGAL